MAHRKSSNPNRWSKSFKKRLISEATEPGSSFEKIAQAYGLKASQLLVWQKRYGDTSIVTNPAFFPIEVLSEQESIPEISEQGGFAALPTTGPDFEIDLPCGTQLRCGHDVNPALLTEALFILRALA